LIDCDFINNTATYVGGAIDAYQSYVTVKNCHMMNNAVVISNNSHGGGAISAQETVVTLIGSENPQHPTMIINNSGILGGAIRSFDATLTIPIGYFMIRSNLATVRFQLFFQFLVFVVTFYIET
jgi:predicted outer membrane repeat protein